MNLLARLPEPDSDDLLLHKCDLADAMECLKTRWSFRSSQPLVSALEINRAAILSLLQSSQRILDTLLAPAETHDCERPEDCGHPHCRAKVDAWQAEYPADHADEIHADLVSLVTCDEATA